MSTYFYSQPELNVSFRSDYRKAVFGLYHAAFLDNDDHYILPEEDKESIIATLSFYEKDVKRLNTYPVFDGKSFFRRSINDEEVFKQVLGLPDVIYKTLDLKKDILSQIPFRSGLWELKRASYLMINRKAQKNWYRDDFKLYCLKNGLFFLYDETKPFIERDEEGLPVFFDTERFTPELKKYYDQAKSTRFAIDLLGNRADNDFIAEMQKYDDFSFSERVDYFVNNIYDQRLADINQDPVFRRKYAYLLRQYISALVNYLYDQYAFDVLHKVTAKLSYLTPSKIHSTRPVYALSSFNADMYSLDGKHYFFDPADRKRIQTLIGLAIKENPGGSLLTIYSHLGLPFEGYPSSLEDKDFTADSLLSSLTFGKTLTSEERYLTAKRYDTFYSYLSEEMEHKRAFLLRKLLDNGVQILSESPIFAKNELNHIEINIFDADRPQSLRLLFDDERCSLVKNIFPTYLFVENEMFDDTLKAALTTLDSASDEKAVHYFFHAFKGYTIDRVVELMLVTFDCQQINYPGLTKFFEYLLTYPLQLVEKDYRIASIEKNDTLALMALDGLPKQQDTFEPNLPYPYVSFGKLAYSFRHSFFSKAYLCSCQKDAILSKVNYYRNLWSTLHPKNTNLEEQNDYVLSHLGLPDNVVQRIDKREDLVSQLPFKDNLCHLCHHSAPSYHENVDDNEIGPYNVYLTYIRARAALKGVYFDEAISLDYDLYSFFHQLETGEYHALISVDRDKIDPRLLPYINVSKPMIVSLFAAFFPNSLGSQAFYNQMLSFLSLGEKTIQKLMFHCEPKDYLLINQHMMVFTHLVFLYKMIELAYGITVSPDIVPPTETEFGLNFDYNPRLVFPYVLLGQYYNAYTDDIQSGEYYLCSCDKESMLNLAKTFNITYENRKMDKEIETPILLGLVGLPYLVVLKYSAFDLSVHSVDELFEQMNFKESICRRCLNVNHAAFDEPFTKAFPFKEDHRAEYDFAINRMLHDGFRVLSDSPLSEIKYHKNMRFDLDLSVEDNLPYIDFDYNDVPEALFTFFATSQEQLKNDLYDFAKVCGQTSEVMAYASGILLDAHLRDPQSIFNFFVGEEESTLRDTLKKYFPEISRVRENFVDPVLQAIAGFLYYRIEKLVEKYALLESRVGR